MNYIRHSFPYAAMRQHIRPSVGLRSPGPAFSRRCFASEKPSGQAKNPRWLLVSIGLGLPISIYLWQRGDTKKPSSKPHTQPRGANQEYSQESEATQVGGQNIKSGSSGGDVPRGMGAPNGPGSISAKQEGLSNADTMNPYVNEPGKSKKGEGETDSVKAKGTIRPGRPQV
ncbi:unnamed protein product [Penicillium roqueforti FM164]|uniref:Genomic scaffold, ProqFM164S04 n=1 Tax=Penicillium roqueforti (strain FM164) TaxID=1365484 RepID=W6QZY8_PENRF|nr:unnamed protein product [Penicillium roqueforti FM164]